MRALIPASAATVALAASVLFAPAALAHNAPGDNGNVKIHDAKTGEELHRNEPHVCTFYLDGFRFDGAQKAEWHIERWSPTDGDKGETVKSGSLTLDGSGHERTEDLALPDGHYKLFWNFDGEHGRAKHKVFWVDCTDSGGGNGGTGTPTSGSGSPSASQSPSGSASPSASAPGGGEQPGGSASATAAPSATDTTVAGSGGSGGSESGGLAETGAQVGGITLGALLLVGAGAVLVTRRRKGAGQH
ncbi:LPXTG cell wall anchor domain-containing protein [Actinacidiphila glaucinigra]|uniref:LPXTG cell wall anchor domain-containing protein n=1 Tax=Actinacidiphila glaucinigra TaxID=235986 RepID=UPI0037144BAF